MTKDALRVRILPGDDNWHSTLEAVDAAGATVASARVRLAVRGELAHTYPAGLADRQLDVGAGASAAGIASIIRTAFELNPRCRRVVWAIPVGDLATIGLAEDAGMRFVVDVDTSSSEVSLLVAEPDWVIVQPSAIEDIPL